MKATWIVLACVVLALCCESDAYVFQDGEVPGVLIQPTASGYARSALARPSCKGIYGPICGDCNTLWTCVGDEEPVRQQNCEQMNPGKPLCEQNACQWEVSASSKCASPLRCTSQGYFPNPTNCTQYYYCEDASLSSKVYQCPPGYSYNSATTLCRRSECQSIDCLANADHYVAFPGNHIYFAYCLNTLGVSTPIMFRCPNDYLNHTFFNVASQQCEFQCPYEGRFVDFRDQSSFYECLPVSENELGWVVRRQQCLAGLVFDGYRKVCRKPYNWELSTYDPTTTTATPDRK